MKSLKNKQNSEIRDSFNKAAPYLNIGYTLIGSIILFGFLGHLADEKTGMAPVFSLAGLFFGLGLGFYNMYRVIKNMEQR
ncbi:MAG: AtpZ/AtpI family protein [Calditrichaceae bacterium]|nr:AtpZ/AtpI family protein [Calditrichaceae bacterium]MBN2707519.1 AtpZ/AtpI family protein [Calditrichaceae bacterium]RQV95608.1 MAG: AtpZ/AtpI family protein [Calditrichota bacterium]